MVQLVICEDRSMEPNDIARIFGSLERNATLRLLSLTGCTGVEGDIVLQTITETLQVNPWIEEIDLSETPLQIARKADGIYEKLRQKGALIPENDLLTDLPQTMPTCCRLFLCGQELAGTPEIKIRTIHDGGMTVSIWNLAGQYENCALHDLMFPGHGSPSFFPYNIQLVPKASKQGSKEPDRDRRKPAILAQVHSLKFKENIITNAPTTSP